MACLKKKKTSSSSLVFSPKAGFGRPLSAKDGIAGEKWPVNFACDFDFHVNPGFFDMPQICDMGDGFTSPPRKAYIYIYIYIYASLQRQFLCRTVECNMKPWYYCEISIWILVRQS